MTVEDREVLREVWEGRIPTEFKLAEEDLEQVGNILFSFYSLIRFFLINYVNHLLSLC